MPEGPLAGVRILEITQIIAGPLAGMLLADMGAEVIKIEPPPGEPWRQFAQFVPGESRPYQSLNRGKWSLALDLRHPRGREVVRALAREMDVVLVNYRPGVAERLGIDEPALRRENPDLIYVDNTAFGNVGPWADRAGYDIVVQAVSGMMAREGKVDESGNPTLIQSTAPADFATGFAIAWGVCAALFARERGGGGERVSSTLLATALALQGSTIMDLPAADGPARDERMARIHALRAGGASYEDLLTAYRESLGVARVGNIFYRAYRTGDGAIAVGALSRPLRDRIRAILGLDYLGIDGPGFDPTDPACQEDGAAAVERAQEIFRTRSTGEWVALFDEHGVPAGPVLFPEEAFETEQVRANAMVVTLEHEVTGEQRQVAPVLEFRDRPLAPQGASPPLGRDTRALLHGIGWDDAAIDALAAEGVVVTRDADAAPTAESG